MSRELAALVAQHLHELADDIAELYGLSEPEPPAEARPQCPPGQHVFAAEDDGCIAIVDDPVFGRYRCGAPQPANG